jgi:hypothetical protein
MSVEPIGLLVLMIGCLCLFYGPRFSIFALPLSTLLGAATVFSGSIGNFLPAQVLIFFIFADFLMRPELLRRGLLSLAPLGPGFWLAFTLCYSVPAAFIMPRLFAGLVDVAPFHPTEAAVGIERLAPSSTNFSQTLYFMTDFICFVTISAYVKSEERMSALARVGVAVAFTELGFAVLDLATYFTGTGGYLDFFRNANYRLLVDAGSGGLKRIVGSFTEASTFAVVTVGAFAFTLNLWLRGVYARPAGLAAFGCLLAVVFATSTTGYVALSALLVAQYAMGINEVIRRKASRNTVIFMVVTPLAAAILVFAIYLYTPAREIATNLITSSLFEKLDSQSGVERSSWNDQAIKAFFGTYGFGAGTGSLRASSWLVGVPASMGVFGAFGYWMFVILVFGERTNSGTPEHSAIKVAAKMSCLTQFVGACVAGGPDLGIWFFIMAAVATAKPVPSSMERFAPNHSRRDLAPGLDSRHSRPVGAAREPG